MHGVKRAALLEDRRVRRVEVFGLAVLDEAAAEGDDAALPVRDRKDHAIAEEIERVAVFGPAQEPRLDEERGLEVLAEHPLQCVARVGRPAEAEARDRRRIEAAARKIFARFLCARLLELGLEEGAGRLAHVVQRLGARRALAVLGQLVRDLQPGFLGERLDRLAESGAADAHRKADDVAVRAAAEAMIERLVLDHGEGRRLLVVERAQADILAPAPHELDVAAHDARKRDAISDFVEELRRVGHVRPLHQVPMITQRTTA